MNLRTFRLVVLVQQRCARRSLMNLLKWSTYWLVSRTSSFLTSQHAGYAAVAEEGRVQVFTLPMIGLLELHTAHFLYLNGLLQQLEAQELVYTVVLALVVVIH